MSADLHHLDPTQLDREARKLRALARGLVADTATADDLAQEAWLTALRKPPRPGFSVGAWLHGILRRQARQRRRDEARRMAREHRTAAPDVSGPDDDPAERLQHLDLLRHLLDEVRALDEPFRSTVLLRFVDGLDTATTATRLGVPEATVRSRLHRGLERLRGRLDQLTPGGRSGWLLPLTAFATAGLIGGSAAAATAAATIGTANTSKLTAALTLSMNAKPKLLLTAVGLAVIGALAILQPWSGSAGDLAPRTTGEPRTAASATSGQTRGADADPQADGATARRVVTPGDRDSADQTSAGSGPVLQIVGRVVGAEDQPLAGALVEASPGVGPGAWGKGKSGSDASGTGKSAKVDAKSDQPSDPAKGSSAGKASKSAAGEASEAAAKPTLAGGSRDRSPLRGTARTRTDADGNYRLELPLGSESATRVWIRATAATHVGRIESLTASPPSLQMDFALRPARVLRGRAIDSAGVGVAAAEVWTWDAAQQPTTTDADGRFALDDLDPKRKGGWLAVRADGFQQAYAEFTLPQDGSEPAPVEVVLQPGATLAGIVLAAGRPLEDVTIALGDGKSERSTRSDADGRFRFDGAPPGRQSLTAGHPAYPPVTRSVEIPEPGTTSEIRIDLPRGRELLGTVRDGDGRPIASALVTGRQGKSTLRNATTDVDGAFRMDGLPMEDLALTCAAPGHLPLANPEAVPVGVRRVELTLRRAARLAGTVVDATTGEPVTRFEIEVRPAARDVDTVADTASGKAGGGKGGGSSWGKPAGQRVDHPDGHWMAGDGKLAAGFVADVVVRAEGYAPAIARGLVASLDATPADHVTRLSAGATLAGLVLSADGEPLGKAVLRMPDGQVLASAGDGSFTLENAPHGSSQLAIEHADWGVSRHELRIPSDVTEWQQTFRLPHQAVLLGIVRDADGQPLPSARIRLTALDAGPATGRSWDDKADEVGRYAFRGLPPGSYRLAKVATDGKAVETLALFVDLDGNAERTLDLAADPETTGRLRGSLSAPDGAPGQVWLHLVPLGDSEDTPPERRRNERWVRTRDGIIDVSELPIGRYRIDANSFDDRRLRGTLEIDLQPGAAQPIRLTLDTR